MGARSKRAKVVRQEKEFDLSRLEAQLRLPRDGRSTIDAWSWADIYAAREEQMLGQFVRPARMAEQMRCDDALFTARANRAAPQSCIPVKVQSVGGARGDIVASEADALFGVNGIGIRAGTLKNIHDCFVDHGVAFGCNVATPREDGSRVDFEMHYWPIEYVRWDPVYRVFRARADPNTVQPGDIPDEPSSDGNSFGYSGAYWIPVVHGDGRWVIFSDREIEPFRANAAILPAALVWARHAFAARDWARGSNAHGSAKVVGKLPTGVPLQVAGALSAEAGAFLAALRAMATADAPAVIIPAGAEAEYVTNNSTAWQVWKELVDNAEKAAARIYLGTDGTLGTQGGAPGVDIKELFGVAKVKVEGDLEVLTRGIDTGLIQPWCAVNFGDSKLAPSRKYLIPNQEKQALQDDLSKRTAAYFAALKTAKEAGLVLTETYIAQLAGDFDLRIPQLSSPPVAAPIPGAASAAPAAPAAPKLALAQ